MFSLEGYRVLVTGGSGSIGSSIAKAMALMGADIVISGTKLDVLNDVASEIRELSDRNIEVLRCDLSNADDAKDLVRLAEDKIGPIDVLVNNAGINKDVLFSKMSVQDFDSVLGLNLRSVFILTQCAAISMAPRRFGRIINITSVVGLTGNIGQANYCASKAGMIGLSKAVALEYAKRGITVNCVAPGAIDSPMIENLGDQAKDRFLTKIPMGRLGAPEDVAVTCCFLASKEASYITGQTIHVNGGMLMP
ncbi:MAG: 3-oxoacyl-ACP reductase FabG [Holosporales bacterium]|jgi:3-oxoacyl-[acyl-carrier protein] reductase|nr:3-oxoacyl-ACP reductase FabG [Holosporales bacterium]